MEECRNKVSNLHAIQSQNIGKLLANQLEEPLRLGGAMGGPYPCAASSRLYFAPPKRGCLQGVQVNLPKEFTGSPPLGVGPRPMAPPWLGGGNTLARGLVEGGAPMAPPRVFVLSIVLLVDLLVFIRSLVNLLVCLLILLVNLPVFWDWIACN